MAHLHKTLFSTGRIEFSTPNYFIREYIKFFMSLISQVIRFDCQITSFHCFRICSATWIHCRQCASSIFASLFNLWECYALYNLLYMNLHWNYKSCFWSLWLWFYLVYLCYYNPGKNLCRIPQFSSFLKYWKFRINLPNQRLYLGNEWILL